MKKFFFLLSFMMIFLCLSGVSMATPYTWVDDIDFNPDVKLNNWQSYSYTHDLTDNAPVAFTVGEDSIFTYYLTVSLYDDNGRWDGGELAFVDQPGVIGDGYYNFSWTSSTYGWSIAGLLQLNLTGTLSVTIDSIYGDFYLASSTLTASGDNADPVPEPATMLLLGSGLVGLAAGSRKKRGKK